jgi:hypothetical protein
VNSGLNEFGLGVIISYSDYRFRDPEVYPPSDETPGTFLSLDREPRTYMNELILSRCRRVPEAVEVMERFVADHPEMMGGNHLLADREGTLAIVEHCEGQAAVAYYTDTGYAARGNNSALLIREKQAGISVIHDCLERHRQMEEFLAGQLSTVRAGEDRAFIEASRGLLSSHRGAPDEMGAICVHELKARGTRAPAVGPFMDGPRRTVTGMIFDLQARRMLYTAGNPCASEWQAAQL